MATHSIVRAARRFILPFALFLFIILARHLLPTNLKLAASTAGSQTKVHIEGRWKSIHATLGLPLLPDIVSFPSSPTDIMSSVSLPRSSRFDLKRKRSLEAVSQKSKSLQLHFAADALEQPVSIERMAASFRATAFAEKAIVIEQARVRQQRQGQTPRGQRRPPSWGTRTAKISLGKR